MTISATISTASPRVTLRRALGLAFGVAISIGLTIGAGILRAPADAAARLPSLALFFGAWVAGGLYALLGANALSELAAMIPESGGQLVYAREAYGPYASFVVGWSDWASTCGTIAAVGFVFAESVGALVPPLAGYPIAVALAMAATLTAILWRGVRWSDRTQRFTTAVKAIGLVALVVTCIAYRGAPATVSPTAPPPAIPTFAGFIIAMQGIIYTYDGWTAPLYFSEEVTEPGRQLPRSIIGGLALIMLLYLGLNIAFLHVVPLAAMAQSPLPAATAAGQIFGPHGDTIVRLIVVLALPSTICACLLVASRTIFGLSREGLASNHGVSVNTGGSPTPALLVSALMGAAFLLSGTFEAVVAILSFFFVANYMLSFGAVFLLRWREPNRTRPYHAKGHPWTTGLAFFGSIAFLVGAVLSDPHNTRYAVLLLVLSYPAYRILKWRASLRAAAT